MTRSVSTIEELKEAIETASWFERLGSYSGDGPGVAVSAESWQLWVRNARNAEFNLPGSRKDPLGIAEWLPTSFSQIDPVRGMELQSLERARPDEEALRETRLVIAKLALQSLRRMHMHPLLEVGPSDYSVTARGAAGNACRAAATEIDLDTPGFWCSLIPIYRGGNWPLAIDSKGELLVL